MTMLNQMLQKITEELNVTHEFNSEDLTITTYTSLGNTTPSVHEFELTEIYEAFKERMTSDESNKVRVTH